MTDGDHLENWSNGNNSTTHSPIMINFGVPMHRGTIDAAVSSKVKPKVDVNRQPAPFWISFSLDTSAAEQNIFTEFDT